MSSQRKGPARALRLALTTSNPHTDMGTPHIGMGRDMSIFQIGESPYQYGVHSNEVEGNVTNLQNNRY